MLPRAAQGLYVYGMGAEDIQAHDYLPIERFSLGVARLSWHGQSLEAPIVDGWMEVHRVVLSAPNLDQERALWRALSALADDAASPWWFVRKAPGLKIRRRVGADAGQAALFLGRIAALPGAFLGETRIGGYFDQVELRPLAFRDDCDDWLHAAARAYGHAAQGATVGPEAWCALLIALSRRLLGDDWIGYEALSRLERLRAPFLGVMDSPIATFDPAVLESTIPAPKALGFETSVACLQTLNLIFNMWGLDGVGQAQALTGARAALKPALLTP
jgi:hypothetical protein